MNNYALTQQVKTALKQYDVITDDIVLKEVKRAVTVDDDFKSLPLTEKKRQCQYIFDAIRRLDILQKYIDDETVTEIMVNGTESIFVERHGIITKVDEVFTDAAVLDTLIQKIVSDVNRAINTASPIVDARLHDGSRVNIVLPPIAINGPILTIRKFRKDNYQLRDLVQLGALTSEMADVLIQAVCDRKNIFISGGTGSGKTTFLNALSGHIPKDQRVISIEDSAELKLEDIDNWVRLETRNANAEGVGRITIKDLIKTALRMRPDRIIVGEVRGDEALDMLQAMNTGHDGSLSTGHANSVEDMLRRLETMVFSAKEMPMQSIKQQIGSAIDIVVHLARVEGGKRKVVQIKALTGTDGDRYTFDTLYTEANYETH